MYDGMGKEDARWVALYGVECLDSSWSDKNLYRHQKHDAHAWVTQAAGTGIRVIHSNVLASGRFPG